MTGNDWLDSEDATEVLRLMLWTTGPIANWLRKDGENIPPKAEFEQAYVMRWLLGLVRDHGADWRKLATDRLSKIREKHTAEGKDAANAR